jgi:hypothetical protein
LLQTVYLILEYKLMLLLLLGMAGATLPSTARQLPMRQYGLNLESFGAPGLAAEDTLYLDMSGWYDRLSLATG